MAKIRYIDKKTKRVKPIRLRTKIKKQLPLIFSLLINLGLLYLLYVK